eukprot:TRINITY_DN12691_c0_g1_i2.p1 TRINITY_DN12691_c0_g1~~TRINITY_DN12691_c0_g1_i2.p1  ORF type:complete len:107 (-),score=11.25 TRINITY_DN12691_c0_g1_i2:237-557(-)
MVLTLEGRHFIRLQSTILGITALQKSVTMMLLWLGGRASTASQFTDKELAPQHAPRKVPVPMGRECQGETAMLRHDWSGEAWHVVNACLSRQQNGAHSLHALFDKA